MLLENKVFNKRAQFSNYVLFRNGFIYFRMKFNLETKGHWSIHNINIFRF